MKIEETIITQKIDFKKILRRGIQVSADLLSETARYGQNVAKILLDEGTEDNWPLKHHDQACTSQQEIIEESAALQAAALTAEQPAPGPAESSSEPGR